ncbi:hypothetical protein CEXT_456701 [Caerostris extrusa]|uniref:Uncharacterized protein n=1 Tax=Caerostris extrusa TaxID=172846 RepID=A0AAV4Y9I1_CAEEX|nr:hypothetical protein CEXT_456701 [Caerostris extrusa]
MSATSVELILPTTFALYTFDTMAVSTILKSEISSIILDESQENRWAITVAENCWLGAKKCSSFPLLTVDFNCSLIFSLTMHDTTEHAWNFISLHVTHETRPISNTAEL